MTACSVDTDVHPVEPLRMCIEEGLVQLETEVRILARADVAVVRSAVQAIDALPEPSLCLDAERLTRWYPEGSKERAEVADVRRELARARGMADAGDVAEGRAMAAAAMDAAGRAGWEPTAAEASFLVADLDELRGEFSAAREGYRRALELAMKVGDDGLAGRVARKTCWFEGVHEGKLASAFAWCEVAELLFDRAGDDSASQRGLLAQTRGLLLGDAGRHEEAEQQLVRALELRREALGDRHPWVAASLAELGAVRHQQGREEESRVLQEEALDILEGSLGSRHPRTGEMLVNLGNVARSTGEPEAAADYYLRALAVTEAGMGSDHPHVGVILTALGIVRHEQGRLESASSAFSRAVEILGGSSAGASSNLALTLRNHAKVERDLGHAERARSLFERAARTYTRVLGPDDPIVAQVRHEAGSL